MSFNLYIDEAGTSEHEGVTVVAGLLVNMKRDWRRAENALNELFARVPECHRNGFVFHATSLWNDPSYRTGWPMPDRLKLMTQVMTIPRALGIPIAVGKVLKRDEMCKQIAEMTGIRPEDVRHALAFQYCIERADYNLRAYCDPDDVATVICEDVGKKKKLLREWIRRVQQDPELVHAYIDRGTYLEPIFQMQKIERVIDRIHFVEKQDAPLMQIADACAFGLRRMLERFKNGEEFGKAVLGKHPYSSEWFENTQSALLVRHHLEGLVTSKILGA